MKRTEKIEIRVSYDEKQTLSNLAKQEGESVSGLVRSLIEKYMALNTASTERRLPKWKIAAMLIAAALIGHTATLIPMHLHKAKHSEALILPTYVVNGVIGSSAFGVSLEKNENLKEFTIRSEDLTWLTVKLALLESDETNGKINISICKKDNETEPCDAIFNQDMNVERIAPSVLGHKTKSGEFVHIFVQEMA